MKKEKTKLKPKNIHLSEECIKQLSKDAIDAGTDFKNYIQNHLETLSISEKLICDRCGKKEKYQNQLYCWNCWDNKINIDTAVGAVRQKKKNNVF